MPLAKQLAEYISACFTGLWIESHQARRCPSRDLATLPRAEMAAGDLGHRAGLQIPGQNNGQQTDAGGSDPLAAIRSINALASADSSAVLALVNFHRFLSSPEIVQALARQIALGKQNRTFVVILSPVVTIPIELEKLFAVIEHELPSREQIEEIARGVATEAGDLPDGPELHTVLDAAAGLTRYEAEKAFSLSLVRHRRIEPESIWELKSRDAKEERPAFTLPGRRIIRAAWAGLVPQGVLSAAHADLRPGPAARRCFWAFLARERARSPRRSVPKLAVQPSSGRRRA